MRPLKTEHFDCECYTPEHTVRFTYDPEDGILSMDIHLRKWEFWKRVWIAVKYVFGYKSKYGDFDGGAMFEQKALVRLANLALTASARRKELDRELKRLREENK